MGTDSPTGWGALAGMMAAISAQAAHWFIAQPTGSDLRTLLVTAQLLVAAAIAGWAWRRGKALERKPVFGREATIS